MQHCWPIEVCCTLSTVCSGSVARHSSMATSKIECIVVVFFYCRAKTNTQIANSANIRRHDLVRREEAKDQNKNVT